MTQGPAALPTVHQLKVTLRDVRPTTWRRLRVPSDATLGDLDEVLEAAFDWEGGHLHLFEAGSLQFGPEQLIEPLDGGTFGEPIRDEDSTTLAEIAAHPGAALTFTYDLGDDWRHRIEVEEIVPAELDRVYPHCVDGHGLAPEEDTGRLRSGRFDTAALTELNEILADDGVLGQDLGQDADPVSDSAVVRSIFSGSLSSGSLSNGPLIGGSLDLTPSDPIFSGLFPGLTTTSDGPCACGQVHEPEDAPLLRPHHPVPDSILAEFARGSDLVEQALGLARWVGEARTLTSSQLLRPAEAREAVTALGLTEPDLQGKKLRSAKDLPQLHALWTAALAADLIEIRGTRANPGPGIKLWQTDGDNSADQLDSWARLLAGYLHAEAEPSSAWEPVPAGQLAATSAQLFYSLARNPMPAALPALILATEDGPDPASAFWMLEHVVSLMEEAAQNWIRTGVLQVLTETGDGQESPGVAEVKALLEILTEGVADDRGPAGMLLKPLINAVRASPIVQLTPLGSYGLRRILLAHGWEVPEIGDFAHVSADEILDVVEAYEFEDALKEAVVWLEARGDQWSAALDEVLESARSKDPEFGPGRRMTLSIMLQAVGSRGEAMLDALADDPWLSGPAARARHELDLGPEPTLAQELWMAVDVLSADLLMVDLDFDTEEATAMVEDSGVIDLLRQTGAMAAVAALTHPVGRETLILITELEGNGELAAQVRRALGASKPSRRPARSRPKKKKSRKR